MSKGYNSKTDSSAMRLKSGLRITLADWKSLQQSVPAGEMQKLNKGLQNSQKLHPGWITDNIMQAYVERKILPPQVTLVAPSVVSAVLGGSISVAEAADTHFSHLINKSVFLMPYNQSGGHWSLIVADTDAKELLRRYCKPVTQILHLIFYNSGLFII